MARPPKAGRKSYSLESTCAGGEGRALATFFGADTPRPSTERGSVTRRAAAQRRTAKPLTGSRPLIGFWSDQKNRILTIYSPEMM